MNLFLNYFDKKRSGRRTSIKFDNIPIVLVILIVINSLFHSSFCLEPKECHMRIPLDKESEYKLICVEDKCIAIEKDIISFDNYVHKDLSIEDYRRLFGYCQKLGSNVDFYQDTSDKVSLLYIGINTNEGVKYKINSPSDFKEYIGVDLPVKTFISSRDIFLIKESTNVIIPSVRSVFEEGSKLLSYIKSGKINTNSGGYSIAKNFGTFGKSILNYIYDSCTVNLVKYEDTTDPNINNNRNSVYYLWTLKLELYDLDTLYDRSLEFIMTPISSANDFYFKLDECAIAYVCNSIVLSFPPFEDSLFYIRESLNQHIQLQDINKTKIRDTQNIHSKIVYYNNKDIEGSTFSI